MMFVLLLLHFALPFFGTGHQKVATYFRNALAACPPGSSKLS